MIQAKTGGIAGVRNAATARSNVVRNLCIIGELVYLK